MTFAEYKRQLDELAEENPHPMDVVVITSKDDEGNGFSPVVYDPGFGRFGMGEYTGIPKDASAEDKKKINAICVN
jgi:hypothetical protein